MTPEEKAVIEAAMRWYQECGWHAIDPTEPERFLVGAVQSLIYSCPECNQGGHVCPGDGSPVGHTQADCGEHDERATPVDAPVDVPARTSFKAVEVREDDPVWVPATFGLCLAGDRIRIGQEETDVLRTTAGVWFVNTSNYWQPTPWKHTELRMDLAANRGWREYSPDVRCEILMSPARRAAFEIMLKFPGTTQVDG